MAQPLSESDATIELPANAHFSIDSGVEFLLEEGDTSWTAADAALQDNWQTIASKTPNFRQEKRPVWLRFLIHNPHPELQHWMLTIDWALLDDVRLQTRSTAADWSALQLAGGAVPMAERSVQHRLPTFQLELPALTTTEIYLRVQSSNTVIVPMSLIAEPHFQAWDRVQDILMASLYSIVLVMLCYNACLYTLTRDNSYLFYCWYVAGIVLFELVVTGTGSFYLWQTSDWMREHGYAVSTAFVFVGATLFLRHFLSLAMYGGWLLRFNNIFLGYWSFAFLLGAAGVGFISDIQDLAAMFSCVVGLGTTIYLWLARGNVSARYFTIAWSFLILATFYYAASMEGMVERTATAQYSQMAGFVLEVTLLSFALAERINRERAAREEAQQAALRLSQQVAEEKEAKVASQNALIDMQRQTNEELELRVLDRTSELQRAMKNLEIANRELSKLSQTDALTQVSNRRYFDHVFSAELQRGSRAQQPLSLLLVDIDHFKGVNDRYGHLMGDECLRQVAGAIARTVNRNTDLVARYGGEEFAVLLPFTSAEDAVAIAETIRQQVAAIDIVHQGQRIRMSASIGVAGWIPAADESADALIARADEALYQAKHAGRNQTQLAASA